MTGDRVVNFVGRSYYVKALEARWPEFLGGLEDDAVPRYRAWRAEDPKTVTPRSFAELSAAPPSPARDDLLDSLHRWAERFEVKDEWLCDAAVQRLRPLAESALSDRWVYTPPELETPPFVAQIEATWVPVQTWDEFRKERAKDLNRQLKEYGDTVRRLWGDTKVSMPQHAEWTALWQKGLSADDIERLLHAESGRGSKSAAIHRAVRTFAKSIGLTLRPGKAGPPRKT